MKLRAFRNIGIIVGLIIPLFSVISEGRPPFRAAAEQPKADAQDSPDWLIGSWFGASQDTKGRPLTLRLTVDSLGKKGARLRYTAPRDCDITLNYKGNDNGKVTFLMADTTGGFCDKFIGGDLTLWQDEDKSLRVTLTSKNKSYSEQAFLRQSGTKAK